MNTVQECYDALENGYSILLGSGGTLHKRPTGVYVFTPFHHPSVAVATALEEITCDDIHSLFSFMVLRDAVIEEKIASTPYIYESGDVIEADPLFIPYTKE